jgi:replicative DNA helicase
VLSVEKNRSGLTGVDMEFLKRFEQARFETHGQLVRERLVDDRVFVE